jgi:hypothetical protein
MSEAVPLPDAVVLPPLPSLIPSSIPRLVRFKPLSSSNWINWKGRTIRALQILQVWDHVESDVSATRPNPLTDSRVTPTHLAVWDHAEQIALTQILHNIDDTKLTITRKCTTARAAWIALEANFVQASLTSRISILNDINSFTWETPTNVLDHTNRLRALCDNLEESGGSIPMDQLVLHLLNSMPEEYENTVAFLRMQPPASLTLDYVSNSLTAVEMTFKNKTRSQERAYAVFKHNRGRTDPSSSGYGGSNRGPVCSLCKRPGHPRNRCFQDPKVGYPEWWGDRPREGKKESTHRRKHSSADDESGDSDDDIEDDHSSKGKKKLKPTHAISFHVTTEWPDQGPVGLSPLGTINPPATSEPAVLRLSGCSSWVLDSGASTHFCCDRSVLVDLTEMTPMTVHMGCVVTKAYAKGTAVLWVSEDGVNHNHQVTLRDVLYVPDISVNLMSVRQLAQAGYGCIVMGITAHLTLANMTPWAVAHLDERSDLYVMEARASRGRSVIADDTAAGGYHSAMNAGGDGTVKTLSTVGSEPVNMQALGSAPRSAGTGYTAMDAGGNEVESVSVYTVPSYDTLWSVHSDMRSSVCTSVCDCVCNTVYDSVCKSVHSLSNVDNALVPTYIGEGESGERRSASPDEVAPSPVLCP